MGGPAALVVSIHHLAEELLARLADVQFLVLDGGRDVAEAWDSDSSSPCPPETAVLSFCFGCAQAERQIRSFGHCLWKAVAELQLVSKCSKVRPDVVEG